MAQKSGGTRVGRSGQMSGRHILRALLIALIFAGASIVILIYQFPSTDVVDLEQGEVAPKDILAPQQFSYISQIRTQAAQERAKSLISTIYTRPDPNVARQQVNHLRKIFDYLEAVRADPYGSLAEKSEWIAAIPDLSLSDIVVDQILIMNESAWAETRQEALAILDQAMRAEIRENQVLATRRQLPTLVALDTPDEQANVIVDITEDLIKPNTFPDEARTEAERQAAVNGIEPVEVTIEANEAIVSAGEVVSPEKMEALQALQRLQKPEFRWLEDFVAPAVLMLLITVIISVYLVQYAPRILTDSKRLILLALLLLLFIAIAKVMIPDSPLIAYLYPIAALTMMIVTLIDVQLAFILTTILAFLAGFIAGDNSGAIVVYLILSGWTGALALGRSQRVNALIWAGVYVGIINTAVILIFNLSSLSVDITSIGVLLLEGLLNGIFSAGLALIGLFAIGNLLGISTAIQLLDLGRPTHPLLRQLLLRAPGTYHHSLMVSNLAEQAAERVGADALLVRVMAYYHDVGKMQRPYFFIENQPEGINNVHEKLEPQISAQIIISHVTDGLDLAQKYRLPPPLKAGIAQHQGTGLVKYFYFQALKAAEEKHLQIDEANFRYPGPRPQTKETGILMLADVSETMVRALKPGSPEEINEIVQKAIANTLESGQLDECDLTIADLREIREAFVDILLGVHHPRIKYPEKVKAEAQAQADKPEKEIAGQETALPEISADTATPRPTVTPTPLQPLPAESQSRPARLVRRE